MDATTDRPRMTTTTIETTGAVATLMSAAPVAWSHCSGMMNQASRDAAIGELDFLIERAARLRAYIETRNNDAADPAANHAAAVKASNHMASKVRRILGYTNTRNDITF